MSTYTTTSSASFTITNARELSSRVAADMHICGLYYDKPPEAEIRNYSEELAFLLRDGYVTEYEFGYKRNGARVVCWRYTVRTDGSVEVGDNPGKIISFADVSGATFYNFLTYSDKWSSLPPADRKRIREGLPVYRSDGEPPSDGNGYWAGDRNYSSGDIRLSRQTFRPCA